MRVHLTSVSCMLAFLLLGSTGAFAQLAGKYTVDPKGSGTTNYTSMTAAVSALTSSGVNGAVEFSIADGTYSGQLSFSSSISGLSSSNTVTFKSASGDSNKVIITNSGSYTLYFTGADYINF